ncbi:MAG: hypothetical protein ACPGU1_23185, partial [Myxococcota bacterium]
MIISSGTTSGAVGELLDVDVEITTDAPTTGLLVRLEVVAAQGGHFISEGLTSTCGLTLNLSGGGQILSSMAQDLPPGNCTISASLMLTSPVTDGSLLGTLNSGSYSESASGRPASAPEIVGATPLGFQVTAPEVNWSISAPTLVTVGSSPKITFSLDGSAGGLTAGGFSGGAYLSPSVATLTLPAGISFSLLPSLDGCGDYTVVSHTATEVSLQSTSDTPSLCVIEGYLTELPFGEHLISASLTSPERALSTLIASVVPSHSANFAPSPGLAGGTINLTYSIANQDRDSGAFTELGFSSDLNMTLSGLTAIGLPDEPCGPGSALSGTSTLTLTGGHIENGETCEFTVILAIPVDASAGVYSHTTSTVNLVTDSGPTTMFAVSTPLIIEALPVISASFDNEHTTPGSSELVHVTMGGSGSEAFADVSFALDISAFAVGAEFTLLGTDSCGPLT